MTSIRDWATRRASEKLAEVRGAFPNWRAQHLQGRPAAAQLDAHDGRADRLDQHPRRLLVGHRADLRAGLPASCQAARWLATVCWTSSTRSSQRALTASDIEEKGGRAGVRQGAWLAARASDARSIQRCGRTSPRTRSRPTGTSACRPPSSGASITRSARPSICPTARPARTCCKAYMLAWDLGCLGITDLPRRQQGRAGAQRRREGGEARRRTPRQR